MVRVLGAAAFALTLTTASAWAQLKNGDFTAAGGANNATNTVINNSTNALNSWTLFGASTPFGCVVTTAHPIAGSGGNTTPGSTPMCGSTHNGGTLGTAQMTTAPPLPPNAGSLPASYTGYIVALDAASTSNYQAGISQTISGLLANRTYTLSFYYTGVQESGFSGSTTGNWQVAYGPTSGSTTTVNTASVTIPSASPVWTLQQISFTTGSGTGGTSEFISFLAAGPGSTQPPFMLLADVSLTLFNVPEPATLMLFGTGLLTLVGTRARRLRRLRTA
jgi:hypothetical protein